MEPWTDLSITSLESPPHPHPPTQKNLSGQFLGLPLNSTTRVAGSTPLTPYHYQLVQVKGWQGQQMSNTSTRWLSGPYRSLSSSITRLLKKEENLRFTLLASLSFAVAACWTVVFPFITLQASQIATLQCRQIQECIKSFKISLGSKHMDLFDTGFGLS